MKPVKEGKVRQIYDNGDSLIMVATDRISCFDVILNNVIEKKGTVLTQMSKFWFDYTKDIMDNHMISTDVKDMPEFFQTPEFEGKSMLCKKLKMLPLECIVRGYITGSGWASYKKDGKYYTNGGRVLFVSGKGKDIKEAYDNAYKRVCEIKSEALFYRHDIGFKAMKGE